MKKLVSIFMVVICIISLASCGNVEIEATVKAFPEFSATDFEGNIISNDIFKDYDVTIINAWSNGCGSCIEEMPDLEQYYQDFKDKNINLMGLSVSAGESSEEFANAKKILDGKGVTYKNIIPDIKSSFYKDFVLEIAGYPMTYLIDKEGNLIGGPVVGVVKNQEELFMKRIDEIKNKK